MHHGKTWSLMLMAALATPALLTPQRAVAAADSGTNVCYKEIDGGGDNNNERVVLDVDRQSDLTFPGGYTQSVFEAVGKNTDKDAQFAKIASVAAPKGLPADVKAKLHAAIVAALNDPAVKPKLLEVGFEIVANTPAQFAAFQAAESARWKHLIETRKITAD